MWVCKESVGFSEKGRDIDKKREKEERKKHTENKKIYIYLNDVVKKIEFLMYDVL